MIIRPTALHTYSDCIDGANNARLCAKCDVRLRWTPKPLGGTTLALPPWHKTLQQPHAASYGLVRPRCDNLDNVDNNSKETIDNS